VANPLKNDCENANTHMMVYTWWCWHICKGGEVGVETDQLSEEMEAKRVTRSDQMLVTDALRLRPITVVVIDIVARGVVLTCGS
jgi:hypothetical protein